MEAGPEGLTLELARTFPAPPDAVFAAFTDPDRLPEWWGPVGFTVPRVDFQPRVGARYRIEMQPPEGEPFYLLGEFREVDAPRRLAYSFVWQPPDPDDVETLVTLTFTRRGDSTAVAFTQGPFKTEARRALHRDGWTDTFNRFERVIPPPA